MARKRGGTLIPVYFGLGALAVFLVVSKKAADKRAAPYLGTVYPPAPPSAFQPQAATMQSNLFYP